MKYEASVHVPVLKKEVLGYLNVGPNKNFIDCTVGGGGHTAAILEKNKPEGKMLGIEIDPELYQKAKSRMAEIPRPKHQIPNRLILVNDSYTNLEKIVKERKFGPIHGILFDLGMSSWHLEKSGRGFSFMRDEPLDMRYCKNQKCSLTASEIVNTWSEKEIEKIIRIFGEERYSQRIAREIVKSRKQKPIKTTFQLKEIIKKVVPQNYEKGRINPATRTFQALRIAVNNELKNLHSALPQALKVLEPKGRLVVISFHSLEDRIVKTFFENQSQKGMLKILTKKPVTPSPKEVEQNPSSRSAKLRASMPTLPFN